MAKPIFEHRHYKAIAAQIALLGAAYSVPVTPEVIAMTFANLFEADNDRFSRERFMAACGGRPINGRDKVR